jgi:type IV pilus assembly protein PilM
VRSLMTQPILGLDIGSFSIKAVCIRKGIMGVEWVGAYQKDLSRFQGPFDWPKEGILGLKEWIADQGLPIDRVVVSLPAHLISLRTLTLPFSDVRRIEKVVPYEIEALLPYPLEEAVIDYHAFESTEGKSNILAAAAPVVLIKHYLEYLSQAGIDPEAVELDGMALMNLVRNSLPEPPGGDAAKKGDTVALDIGASKTVVCILRGGLTTFVRTILWGGQDVTAALSAGFGISPEEAEEWKRESDLTGEDVSALNRKDATETIRRAVEPLLAELHRTIHVYHALDGLESQVPMTGIALYGGGGKLKGLASYLASELDTQAMSLTPKVVSGNGRQWDPVFAVALGLALKGAQPPGGSRMNFRKGEFAPSRETTGLSAKVRYLWIGAFLVLALGVADLYTKYTIRETRFQELKMQVRAQFTTMFPGVHNIVDEVQQAKTAVNELKKKASLFGTGDWTPLQLMAELTQRMPSSVKIEVQDLAIEPGRLRLEAETDSFESVDKVKASLGQFEAFRDVTVSDAKVSADQSKVRFRMTMTLVPRESGQLSVNTLGESNE